MKKQLLVGVILLVSLPVLPVQVQADSAVRPVSRQNTPEISFEVILPSDPSTEQEYKFLIYRSRSPERVQLLLTQDTTQQEQQTQEGQQQTQQPQGESAQQQQPAQQPEQGMQQEQQGQQAQPEKAYPGEPAPPRTAYGWGYAWWWWIVIAGIIIFFIIIFAAWGGWGGGDRGQRPPEDRL